MRKPTAIPTLLPLSLAGECMTEGGGGGGGWWPQSASSIGINSI